MPPPENVLPLQVGNYWIMKDATGFPDKVELKKYIDAEVPIGSRSYFRMVNRWTFEGTATASDTTYYRVDEQGFVYERKAGSGQEANVFRLYAREGEQWVHGNGTMTLTNIDRYSAFNTPINNCRFYSFDILQLLDEEVTTILAPDIGFVGSHSYGSDLQTSEASVYGIVHKFD